MVPLRYALSMSKKTTIEHKGIIKITATTKTDSTCESKPATPAGSLQMWAEGHCKGHQVNKANPKVLRDCQTITNFLLLSLFSFPLFCPTCALADSCCFLWKLWQELSFPFHIPETWRRQKNFPLKWIPEDTLGNYCLRNIV